MVQTKEGQLGLELCYDVCMEVKYSSTRYVYVLQRQSV